jgi:hypothetical protein
MQQTMRQAELLKTIESTIERVVNGKIDRLTNDVKLIHERLDEQDKIMAPAIETIQTLRSGGNFLKWIWPIFLIIGVIVTWIRGV